MRNKNKIGEHWLPRITEKLIMIGSQCYFEFAERPVSKYMLITHAIFPSGSTYRERCVGLYII